MARPIPRSPLLPALALAFALPLFDARGLVASIRAIDSVMMLARRR